MWRARTLAFVFFVAIAAIALTTVASNRASAGSFVYVSNTEGGTVSVIDSTTNTVTATIPIGGDLLGVAISPDGTVAYVGGFQGSVSVIDTAADVVTATIPVGSEPRSIVFSPNGAFAYVTDQALNVVWVINIATKMVVGPLIPVGNTPTGIAITPNGAFVYVVNNCGDGPCFASAGTVSIIDTSSNTVAATVPIGYFPDGIAITPNGAFAYVANQCGEDLSCASDGTLSVISTASQTVTQTIPVGQFLSQFVTISITPDGRFAYVANTSSGGTVSIIDTSTNSVVGSPISVGAFPGALAATPDGRFIYAVNQCGDDPSCASEGTVSVISTATNAVSATVPVGEHPAFLAITPATACTVIYNGTFNGNLTISRGQVCIINGTVTGNVKQYGGGLFTSSATIRGNLQTTGGGTFSIGSTTIDGNLQIQNIPAGSAQNQICGTDVKGNLQFDNSGTAAAIGTTSAWCAGNTIGGNLQVNNNTAPVQVFDDSVGGNLQVNNNTAAVQVFDDIAGGNLQCQSNSSITGNEDTAKGVVARPVRCLLAATVRSVTAPDRGVSRARFASRHCLPLAKPEIPRPPLPTVFHKG